MRPHLVRRAPALLAAAALILSPVLLAGPSHAAPAKVKVSLKVSATKTTVGKAVKFTGKVTGRSSGARVTLQRRSGTKWVKVRTAKVRADQRYTLRTKARTGTTRYRVKVSATSRIRAAKSRTVRVVAKKPATGFTAAQRRILADTNAFRAEQGKAPLVLDAAMSRVATRWSRHLGESGEFAHNPDYAEQIPSGWVLAGENIAAGQTPSTVVNGWMNSPGHRANMLADYTHIGIGAVEVPGSPYGTYFTQVFAAYPDR